MAESKLNKRIVMAHRKQVDGLLTGEEITALRKQSGGCASPVAFVSESRFAHFTRSASPAERQSLMVRAMRAATQAQRNAVEACEQKEKTKRADQV